MKKSKVVLTSIVSGVVLVAALAVVPVMTIGNTATTASGNTARFETGVSSDNAILPVLTRGKVNNIQKTSYEPDRIDLKWDASEGVDGYFVYICDKDASDDYAKAAKVTEPAVSLKELKSGTQYWIKITSFTESDGEVHESSETIKKTATQAAEVTGLHPEHSSDEVEIAWNVSDDASGYRLYRAVEDGDYKLVADIDDPAKTSYQDKDVKEGTLYTYKVCANRTLYNNINYPSEGEVLRLVCGMAAPTQLIASCDAARVNLSWNRSDHATGYNIYFAKEGEKLEYIDATESNYFITDRLDVDQTYTFRVEPYYVVSKGVEARGTYSTCSITVEQNSGPVSVSGDGTYIEISISQQHLWYYEKGQLVLDTDVVTGNNDGECNTPTGRYSISSRATNTVLTGPGYSSPVSYWMGFNGGIGIHDATWRSSFGGDIYNGNGSHGCVNTPYDKVQELYERTDYGTPVIVY